MWLSFGDIVQKYTRKNVWNLELICEIKTSDKYPYKMSCIPHVPRTLYPNKFRMTYLIFIYPNNFKNQNI